MLDANCVVQGPFCEFPHPVKAAVGDASTFTRFFGGLSSQRPAFPHVTPSPDAPRADWRATISPPIDIQETDAAFILIAELPGMTDRDFEIALHGGCITLRGRKPRSARYGGTPRFGERCFGSFSRAFALPDSADANRITAEFDHGLLAVTIAKRTAPQ